MAIDVSAVSYESGREALQLATATDGGSSIQEIASLLEQEAEDHLNSYALDPSDDYGYAIGCGHHTALEVAASAGDINAVERLLEAGADPNAPVHPKGTSVLEAAAAQGRLSVVQRLLEIGAHPDHRGRLSGASPLTTAAKAGHVEICEALLQDGADLSILTEVKSRRAFFSSAIEAAGETSNTTLLELFLGGVQDAANGWNEDDIGVAVDEGRDEDLERLLETKEFLGRAQTSINRALSAAAKSGNMPILQRLLDAGADITGDEENGTDAVAAASSGGQLEVMNKLLQTASDRNNLPVESVTAALQLAVDAGNKALLDLLLQNGADAGRIDIRRAAIEGHLDVLTIILESGALVETTISLNDANFRLEDFTALQLAAQHGHHAIVDLLIAKGAGLNERVTYPRSMEGSTALQLAVAGGHLEITKRLIDAGADVNPPCEVADTPLQAAVRTGDTAILELLLAAGAIADVGGGGGSDYWGRKKSALSVAAGVGNRDLVARLLSIMSPDDAREAAPWALQEAAENHHADIVRQLLRIHPDVNMRREEKHERTLLQTAAENGDMEILEMLLAEGADVNLNPSGGRIPTALQSASERGDLAAVEPLLAAGAEVNVTGSTAPPLLLAIRGGHIRISERLLAAGADIHASAYHGQTMLEAAEDSGDTDIQDWVRSALESRPPPQIDQPSVQGTGPLCETCQMAPLADLFWGNLPDIPQLVLHPSLTALRTSAAAGCPFCYFLWKRFGLTSISIPQPSPVQLNKSSNYKIMHCYVEEPFPSYEKEAESIFIEFPFFTGPLSDDFGAERVPITEDTSSPETYQQIHTWLTTCNNEHSQCRAPSENASLPTRLIYLDTSKDSSSSDPVQAILQPRLVNTNGMEYSECKYVALSYRWPENFPAEAKSSRNNVREQTRGLNTSKLPQIFNDVFQVAAKLGINYVWIDSLCIVQDDPEDWSREAALMIQIYRHAEFTVAAAVPSTNPDLGLFRHGDPSDVSSVTLPGVRDPGKNGSDQDVVLMKPQEEKYSESPLVSRGWCFQEREISLRIVHYTETQVLWECRTVRASEGFPEVIRTSDRDWTTRVLDGDDVDVYIDRAWSRAVEDYSARDLTVYADKLPALSGLAAAVREYKPANCRYLAGLWEDNFTQGLLWSSSIPYGLTVTNTRYPEYVAPTWSWASVAGPISYEGADLSYGQRPTGEDNTTDDDTHTGDPLLKVLDICVYTSTNDPFGAVTHAVLTCTAALIPGSLETWLSGRISDTSPDCEVVTFDGGMRTPIGGMYFDVDPEKYDGLELQCVFCIHVGYPTVFDKYGPGLVVLPTGNRENEYRRIGMMKEMRWDHSFDDDAEIKQITII